jgi:hypothetical protein
MDQVVGQALATFRRINETLPKPSIKQVEAGTRELAV